MPRLLHVWLLALASLLAPCPADELPPVEAIEAWAHEQGLLSRSLRLSDSTETGVGVVAAADIPAGALLVRSPAPLCVTAARARADPGVGPLLLRAEATGPAVDDNVAMAAFLMRAVDVPPPELAPWIRALPASFDLPLTWSEPELLQLQASPARLRAEALRRWSRAEYARIFGAWSEPLDFEGSLSRWTWALSAVWSRSFMLGAVEGSWRVLAPVADLLNHASHVEGAGEAEQGSEQGLELGRSTPPAAKMELHARGDSPRHWHSAAGAAGAGGESYESLPLSDEALTLVATREVSAGEEVHILLLQLRDERDRAEIEPR
ncbi:hypothetical protein EMIHUDRAFT_108977 [Emiliania huxleyi CCMP1516]|uniref:SET domain-containing protein n=2 Tax=Emiliania huxleyi TaxID=2903 RepID=A0A0D3KTY8_EMIH1|nr:hypothetical protein EMIHUDRAFT_108977 [Emiliania huxleyi CCMP1516]EOD39223.1 hypothetical protein EMIHUDRAFT_108977 [Emiliania huxleyi CCMP1516]|eukprot:XP_005791652.1 hypothetical protein EMIHUDRAFT_108977 [Emiliania huxleyi CCMP1516]